MDTRESKANANSAATEAPLPRRDLLILPLIGICTILLCLIAAESLAEHPFASQEVNSCVVPDSVIGARYKPNCTARMKAAEGPWYTSWYNGCGYRTKEPCGPRPAGTTRIALLGSSSSEGYFNNYNETFAYLTGVGLTKILNRSVEVQNLGRAGCTPTCSLNRLDEALALKPNLVILAMSDFDLLKMNTSGTANREAKEVVPVAPTFQKRVFKYLKESSALVAATHFLTVDNPSFARARVATYLTNSGSSGYLWKTYPPTWNDRIEVLDGLLQSAETKCRNAHVPFVLVGLPSFQQVSLMKYQSLPPGVDPNALPMHLAQVAARHQMQFIGTADAFTQPNDEFYVVDGHMNANGNALVARAIIEGLLSQQMPALAPRSEASAGTSGAS